MTDLRFENPLTCHECSQTFASHEPREDVLTNEPDGSGLVRFKIHVACIEPRSRRRRRIADVAAF